MSRLDDPVSVSQRLVGRAAELDVIAGIVDGLARGSAEPVVITGMLQTGRTALLTAAMDIASDRGLLCSTVQGDGTQPLRAALAHGMARAIDALAVRRPGASGLSQMRGAVVDFRASTAAGLAVTCYEMLHLVGRGVRDLGTALLVGIDDLDTWAPAEVEAVIRAGVAAADRGGTAVLVPTMLPSSALMAGGQHLCTEITSVPLRGDDIAELAARGAIDLNGDVCSAVAAAVDGRPANALATLKYLSTDGTARDEATAVAAARAIAERIDETWCAPVVAQLGEDEVAVMSKIAAATADGMADESALPHALAMTVDRYEATRDGLRRRRLLVSARPGTICLSYEPLRRYLAARTPPSPAS